MKAIDILFKEIDKLNKLMQEEENIDKKYHCCVEMKKIISTIETIVEIRYDTICPSNDFI